MASAQAATVQHGVQRSATFWPWMKWTNRRAADCKKYLGTYGTLQTKSASPRLLGNDMLQTPTRSRLRSGSRLTPRRHSNARPTLHPAVNIDRDASTSPKNHGIYCSSGSAAADRRCLTIHGTSDPGWPVNVLKVLVEAKHPVLAKAQHRSGHSLSCEQPQKSAPSRAPYVCSHHRPQSVSTTIADYLLTVLCRGGPRKRQRARARP